MSKYLKKILQKKSENKTQVIIAKELGITQSAVSHALNRIKRCPNCGEILNMGAK